jgi:hypothetical protein
MAEALSEDALQLIVSMLRKIKKDDGFLTDIGLGHVSTEPTQKPPNEDAYTVVSDTETVTSGSGTRIVNSTMTVLIEAIVPCSGKNRMPARLARRSREDIVRALKAPLRDKVLGVTTDERYANSVVAQVTARVGLSHRFPPATP